MFKLQEKDKSNKQKGEVKMNKKLGLLVLVAIMAVGGLYWLQSDSNLEVIPDEVTIIGEDYTDFAAVFGFKESVSIKPYEKKVIKFTKKDKKMIKKVFGYKQAIGIKPSGTIEKKKIKLTKEHKLILAKALGFKNVASLKIIDDKKPVKYTKKQ